MRRGGDLVGEILDERFGDVWSGHAESTGGGGFHRFIDVIDLFSPSFGGKIFSIAIEAFGEPLGSDAAGETFAAGFMSEEGHGIVGGFDHVTGVIKDHDASSAEERSVRADAGIIEREVIEDLVTEKSAGKSGHGDGLNTAARERSASPVVEESFEWEADRDLVVAGACDVA